MGKGNPNSALGRAVEAIFEGLNQDQRRAVEAVRGPVCVLAGAGSGKTTTVTRRIANQVAADAFEPSQVLAVTFTDKAAGEMRTRLAALGTAGVVARTFHSAALAQLRGLATEPVGDILPAKGPSLRRIANTLPKPYRFRPSADLATEIEWAKNRRLTPSIYLDSIGAHEPPIPPDLMLSVFTRYEGGKEQRGLVDFEDLLELAIRMYENDAYAVERFREKYRAFTVDEYQDVNLLQQTLLDSWLGERDDLCAVGDDYQAIYGFTGASPRYLLEMSRRFSRCQVVKLETNYRSSPEILDTANKLVPALGGASKTLRASRPSGPAPVVEAFAVPEDEHTFVARSIRELHEGGVAWDDIAVLYRTNFRSEDYEAALSGARIPFQVRGGAFLSRPAARRLLARLRSSKSTDVAATVRSAAERDGLLDELPDGLGEQEATRQNDLRRFVSLAEEFDGTGTVAEFVSDLSARFESEGDGRGVNLLTYHRAKGLEFEAVFLVRLEEGEIPFRRSLDNESVAEERRLFYVGLTRAKRHLLLTRVGGRLKPSRFLRELGVVRVENVRVATPDEADPVLASLKRWRLERAQTDGVPAFVVFHDSTLVAIAEARPRSRAGLAAISGIGPAKLARYGDELLATLAAKEFGPRKTGGRNSNRD